MHQSSSLLRKREPWPEWATAYVADHYTTTGDTELADLLTAKAEGKRTYTAKMVEKKREAMAWQRNPDQLARIVARNKQQGRYKRSPETKHARGLAEGEIRIWNEKLPDGSLRPSKRIKHNGEMISLSVHMWETHYKQKLPAGHIVTFRDNDPLNCEVDNLLIMTRAENIARNRNFSKSVEQQRTAQEERHTRQRQQYLELKKQLDTVTTRIDKLKSGEKDENYTVDILNSIIKDLNVSRNGIIMELYKLPESVKHE